MWRVIWQHGPGITGPMTSSAVPNVSAMAEAKRSLWSDLNSIGEASPVFPEHPALLRAAVLALPELRSDQSMDLTGYFHIFVPTRQQADELVARLRAEPDVTYADAQRKWQYPVKFGQTRRVATFALPLALPLSATPNLVPEQGYLGPAPGGVDAIYAWSRNGGRGQGIKVIDVESGWNFNHEDLRYQDNGVVFVPNGDDDHGTAVLGIFHGDNNAFGVTGIAHEVAISAASADYDVNQQKWNAAAAIKFAADRLNPGDVILLKMHAPGPNSHDPDPDSQQGFIPVEYWAPEFAAIKYAAAKGIYVVEAGGNGGEDLDAAIYQSAFDRQSRDSGAILVGGGTSMHDAHPRSRVWWSNYGSRLDVQGWGLDIVTTGGLQRAEYHDRVDSQDASKCYTQSFGGTSGASPIVTGVVACISGAVRAAGRTALPAAEMRRLIGATGTAQTDAPDYPAAQRIGALPNLRAALSELGL
jgi:subtilisin family serine protease